MTQKYNNMLRIFLLPFLIGFSQLLLITPALHAQAQDRMPREYTNPEEVVTFSRNTTFQRALDVINQFAQEKLNKVIIDRADTQGNIGIAVPPMHWRDALDLILRVKNRALVEQREFFEIVPYSPQNQSEGQVAATQTQTDGEQEEIPATLDSREVRINAIFFEGNRQALQEIGVDWSTLTENTPDNVNSYVGTGQQQGGGGGGQTGGGGQGGTQSSGTLPATTGFEDQFVTVNSVGAQSVSQNVFNALVNFGQIGNSGISVQALFSAFEADNLGEVLASPSIRVMDGEEGRIQVGQDFSVKQRDFAGNVIDQFFSVGTILNVTPTLITRNDTTIIHLDVTAERSSVQPSSVSTIINKQEAQTQAILIDGEATAIAGLYSSQVAEVRRGVPILKDLPPWLFGLRYLFGYNSKDYEMRELVVLLQAEIQPSIEQRYGKEIKNKFEVLNDTRQRFRDEMKQKETYSPTKMEGLENEETGKAADSTQAQTDKPEEQTLENETAEEEQQPQQPQEEEKAVVVDPEMVSNPVPLNLGPEEEEKDTVEIADPQPQPPTESQISDREDGIQADNERASTAKKDTAETAVEQSAQVNRQQPASTGKKQETTDQNYSYFIIGASFTNQGNAQEYSNMLEQRGFDPIILSNQTTSFHYVAYRGYKTMEQAQAGLDNIRDNHNSEAWLFIKR